MKKFIALGFCVSYMGEKRSILAFCCCMNRIIKKLASFWLLLKLHKLKKSLQHFSIILLHEQYESKTL